MPGSFRDYQTGHPSRPVLVVEVSESSLALDREHKGSLYARAGLADYWIVNLPERALEVYRDPEPDPAAPFGWRYRIGHGARARGLCLSARPARPADPHRRSIALAPLFQGLACWCERKWARSIRSWSVSPASSCDMAPP